MLIRMLAMDQVPVIPFDNKIAVAQMESAYSTLLARKVPNDCDPKRKSSCVTASLAKDGKPHPRVSRDVFDLS